MSDTHPHPRKIAIIGAGKIGKELCKELTEHHMADEIVLWNRSVDKIENNEFKGFVRGVRQANLLSAEDHKVSEFIPLTGEENLDKALQNADIVLVTAGVPRNPKIPDRSDLMDKNCPIIDSVAPHAAKVAPNAKFIIATNPVDSMTQRFYEQSGINAKNIMGLSGSLDRSRLLMAIHEHLEIPETRKIKGAHVIGQHGDAMLPLLSNITIEQQDGSFKKLTEYPEDKLALITLDTVKGGAKFQPLLGTSDHIAPAAALFKITKAIVDTGWKGKEYKDLTNSFIDETGRAIGQRGRITKEGFQPFPRLEQLKNLSATEKLAFEKAEAAVDADMKLLPSSAPTKVGDVEISNEKSVIKK